MIHCYDADTITCILERIARPAMKECGPPAYSVQRDTGLIEIHEAAAIRWCRLARSRAAQNSKSNKRK
jgi:hypothetical protein